MNLKTEKLQRKSVKQRIAFLKRLIKLINKHLVRPIVFTRLINIQ